jgi:putative oxidoreductase
MIGAVLLILGVGTRILALGFLIDMIVAILTVRIGMAKDRFAGGGEIGWEFEFSLAIMALALLFTGPGSLALNVLAGW